LRILIVRLLLDGWLDAGDVATLDMLFNIPVPVREPAKSLFMLTALGMRGSSARGKRPSREGGRGDISVADWAIELPSTGGAVFEGGLGVERVGSSPLRSVPEEYAESVGGAGLATMGVRSGL